MLPAGRYDLEIVESAYEPDAVGSAMQLLLKCQVGGGEFDCCPLDLEMALEGEGQADGQRHFAALRRAVGVPNPEHTDELRFKRFEVTPGVANGRNVIRSYGEGGA